MSRAITEVPGISVGHYTNLKAATGCTVVLCPEGAVCGVDVRGSAPGTRETDLLSPANLVEQVHAILLSGGSAFGLDAAGGVMRYLEERGYGLVRGAVKIPIVPAAILFDLTIGNPLVRPGLEEGYQACLASSKQVAEGSVGVGTGATVGKAVGMELAMKGGVGTHAEELGEGIIVGALMAVNAWGEVVEPETGKTIAGPRQPSGHGFLSTMEVLRHRKPQARGRSNSTTIGVVATNAQLTKMQATKVAQMAQDGIARAIHPAHTMFDGDAIFCLSLGKKEAEITAVGSVAAEVVSQAIIRAVKQAEGLCDIPSVKELPRG